ncbi:hypothetical protein CPB84DRAFT_1777722 [Gymnopilus junonius]|uniref:Uncharacterized protein n=1 Tax=Gymnopilus junonius TaxID=109634 RepID=A0A9P5TMG7_GYMJU|nr:hypothetical protein CPB84DRAFT_1777722 [Gymnopilus junonius]
MAQAEAEVPAAPAYLHDVPSLHETRPHLPAVLGNLDLNRGILQGDALDTQDVVDAEKVVKGLKAVVQFGLDNNINAADIDASTARSNTIQAQHAFAPLNIYQLLQGIQAGMQQINDTMDLRFNEIDLRLAKTEALARNARIIARNRASAVPSLYEPIYKTVAGDGRALAQALLDFPSAPLPNSPQVGTLPQDFDDTLKREFSQYDGTDVAKLIIFYNESFGITQGMDEYDCVNRLYFYLTM